MKRLLLVMLLTAAAANVAAQTRQTTSPAKLPKLQAARDPSAAAPIQKKLETFLRKLYAWGPSFRVKIGVLRDAPAPGFYEVPVEVTMGEQSDSATFFVSKDGRYLLRGDIQDMSTDPLAAVRSQIHLADSPSKGPADARVVVVEYADFQCPTCGQLHKVLHEIEPQYPQVRFVYKDFPLTHIHPWAMTAAIAGRCAYRQNPETFWKLHDSIYDKQEVISAENAWQKMLDFAGEAGLDTTAFRACTAGPEATQAVQQSIKEAQALKVANTPTVFVNGRRIIGADRGVLEQYIQYELGSLAPTSPARPEQH